MFLSNYTLLFLSLVPAGTVSERLPMPREVLIAQAPTPAPKPDPKPVPKPTPAPAAKPTLTLPEIVTATPGLDFIISGTTNCTSVVWAFPDGGLAPPRISLEELFEIPATWKKKPASLLLNAGNAGKYRVYAVGANATGQTEFQIVTVIVGTPPAPNTPKLTNIAPATGNAGTAITITGSNLDTVTTVTVGGVQVTGLQVTATVITGIMNTTKVGAADVVATSPAGSGSLVGGFLVTDIPPPSPAPIPDAGFRSLIIYDTNQLSTYPSSQITVIGSTTIRQYLNQKCVKVNGTPESRFFDQSTDLAAESTIWQNAMKRKRDSLPWIIISDGKQGYEGPLPKTVDDTMKLLQKYGG